MQLYILLTEKCNLHCTMCIRGKQQGRTIDFNQLKLLSFVNRIQDDVIILTGGEPTLHPQFCDIVHYFSNKCKLVVVTTNGTTNYDYKKLEDIKNLHIQISIDGDIHEHDQIRGVGSYDKSFQCLKLLNSLMMKFSVATVANRYNISSLDQLVNRLSMLKCMAYWKVSYEMPFENKSYQQMLSAEEWNNLVDHLIQITPFRLKVKKIFPIELYEKNMSFLLKSTNNRCQNCGSGIDKIYIYPDFTVFPCTCLTDFPVGNLLTQPLDAILCGNEIKKFSNYQVDETSPCQICRYKPLCNGGCIGMSYHFFGKLGKGDIRCPLMTL